MKKVIVNPFISISLTVLASTANSAVLTGSGLLPIPSPNDPISYVGPAYTPGVASQTGDWSAPADTPWVGGDFTVYHPTGTLPVSPNVGEFRYDFTNMTNGGGLLPVGTYFWIGDVDFGSGNNEVFELQANDSSGGLLDEWLDEPIFVNGSGVAPGNMPAYTWDAINQKYIFDGNGVPGNPSIGIFMENNQEIAFLSVNKLDTNYNFALLAPQTAVPIPAAAWLFSSSLIGLGILRRKRK